MAVSSLTKQYERELSLVRQSIMASRFTGHWCEPEALFEIVSDADKEPAWVAFNRIHEVKTAG
jgi:hypothetical protein